MYLSITSSVWLRSVVHSMRTYFEYILYKEYDKNQALFNIYSTYYKLYTY